MQRILWGVAIVLVASVAWRYKGSMTQAFEPPPPPAKPIVFDNGTVRQYQAAPQTTDQAALRPLPSGVMRKCTRGYETNFTDVACPPGYSEEALNSSKRALGSDEDTTGSSPAQPPLASK